MDERTIADDVLDELKRQPEMQLACAILETEIKALRRQRDHAEFIARKWSDSVDRILTTLRAGDTTKAADAAGGE